MGLAEKNDTVLIHTVFSTWEGWLMEHKANKEIHDKYKAMITDAEDALIAFKQKQLGISRNMLKRGADGGDKALLADALKFWYKYVIEEGHTRAMDKQLEEAQAKLKNARQTAQDNSKAVMMRMSAGNDQALVHVCVQAWVNALEELKKDREIDAAAKAAEEQYKEFMAKKRENGAGVLERMSDASDTGLLHTML